jgi:hypothetical protein
LRTICCTWRVANPVFEPKDEQEGKQKKISQKKWRKSGKKLKRNEEHDAVLNGGIG